MKKITAIVFIKEREKGLLSIGENREKSLIPVLGGTRIIDYYVGPLISNGFDKVIVLIDKDMTHVKDYLVYSYGTGEFTIISELDLFNTLLNLLKTVEKEEVLFLRADGIIFQEWKEFREKLLILKDDYYKIVSKDKNIVGFYLSKSRFLKALKGKTFNCQEGESKADRLWSLLRDNIFSKINEITIDGYYDNLKTVKDYYDFHFRWLRKMVNVKLTSFLTVHQDALKEENASRISSMGFVKDSYISFSCTIDGYVENSIIFSNTKVGQRAKIKDSIIMNNNYIGDKAVIENSIICDNHELFAKITPNIGEDAKIGENDNSGTNGIYKNIIYEGITLIGQNVEIPKGFRISRNCYIASGVNKAAIKSMGRLKPGESILKG